MSEQFHTASMAAVFFNSGLILLCLVVLLWLAIHSRRWTGPYIEARLDEQQKVLDILRGNMGRIANEHMNDRHEALASSERLWEELRRIHTRLDAIRCPLSDPSCPLKIMVSPDEERRG